MIYAKVIADSISPNGDRLTTMEINFWRSMLPEVNTHRKASKNSGSSRARPLRKKNRTGTLDGIEDSPAGPEVWASEQPGMSGGKELEGVDYELARDMFDKARESMVSIVEGYLTKVRALYPDLLEKDLKAHILHKSLINRLLEPFMWHRVIFSSTEWENLFAQRCHPDAQPEFRILAEAMRDALAASTPVKLGYGEYHTPYITREDSPSLLERIKASIARCARVSFLTHDGERDIKEDINLFDRLMSQNPPHYSPSEHVATPAKPKRWYTPWRKKPLGNFDGWHQVRHLKKDNLV